MTLHYKREIDGLRAVAVLSVMLFHAEIPGFPGGYIGVDVFFVISGYLISSIVLGDLEKQRFSFLSFYERRARRLMPALACVLLLSTAAAYLLMPADALMAYSKTLFATAIFFSNVYFYITSGYFSAASEENPLIHTWSLAIEEQYYIFFPALLFFLWKCGKDKLTVLIVFLSLCSLGLSQFLAYKKFDDANFYLIFSRAWEFFLGALISFIPLKRLQFSSALKNILAAAGFILIAGSVCFFDKNTPFPGIYTLIPVVGACLIILFSGSKTAIGKLLSSNLFVSTGLISYSLYLWHQPLLAFLRLKHVGKLPLEWTALAILASFMLAYGSWKYIEAPFRNRALFSRKQIFIYTIAATIVFLAIGRLGNTFKGFEQRFETPQYTDSILSSPKRQECHTQGTDYLKPEKACRYFGKNITWATFGDSHTVELAYALAKEIEKEDEGVLQLSFSGCPPSLLFEAQRPGCSSWTKESLLYLEENREIKNILLGYRYTAFLYGYQLEAYPGLPDENPSSRLAGDSHYLSAHDARELYWNSFSEMVSRLVRAGKNVYVLYPIPELPIHISKAITPLFPFSSKTMLDLQHATPVNYYFLRNKFILEKLDSLPYGEQLHSVKPFQALCGESFCPAVKNNAALYFDDNHLSVSGAALVAKNIITQSASRQQAAQ